MQKVFEKIIYKLEEKIKEYDERIERRNDACHFDETENMRKLDDRAKGIEQAIEIVKQEAEQYKDFDMEFARKCVELVEKMNVCDLVAENCRLSNENRFLKLKDYDNG